MKKLAKLSNPLFILKENYFLSQDEHKLSTKRLDRFLQNNLGSEMDLLSLSFDLNCSVL